jgi:hypothetical protein
MDGWMKLDRGRYIDLSITLSLHARCTKRTYSSFLFSVIRVYLELHTSGQCDVPNLMFLCHSFFVSLEGRILIATFILSESEGMCRLERKLRVGRLCSYPPLSAFHPFTDNHTFVDNYYVDLTAVSRA